MPEENYSAPYQIKAFYVSGTKLSNRDLQEYTAIYFPSTSKVQFLGMYKWCSANVFSDSNQKHVLAVLREYSFYNVE